MPRLAVAFVELQANLKPLTAGLASGRRLVATNVAQMNKALSHFGTGSSLREINRSMAAVAVSAKKGMRAATTGSKQASRAAQTYKLGLSEARKAALGLSKSYKKTGAEAARAGVKAAQAFKRAAASTAAAKPRKQATPASLRNVQAATKAFQALGATAAKAVGQVSANLKLVIDRVEVLKTKLRGVTAPMTAAFDRGVVSIKAFMRVKDSAIKNLTKFKQAGKEVGSVVAKQFVSIKVPLTGIRERIVSVQKAVTSLKNAAKGIHTHLVKPLKESSLAAKKVTSAITGTGKAITSLKAKMKQLKTAMTAPWREANKLMDTFQKKVKSRRNIALLSQSLKKLSSSAAGAFKKTAQAAAQLLKVMDTIRRRKDALATNFKKFGTIVQGALAPIIGLFRGLKAPMVTMGRIVNKMRVDLGFFASLLSGALRRATADATNFFAAFRRGRGAFAILGALLRSLGKDLLQLRHHFRVVYRILRRDFRKGFRAVFAAAPGIIKSQVALIRNLIVKLMSPVGRAFSALQPVAARAFARLSAAIKPHLLTVQGLVQRVSARMQGFFANIGQAFSGRASRGLRTMTVMFKALQIRIGRVGQSIKRALTFRAPTTALGKFIKSFIDVRRAVRASKQSIFDMIGAYRQYQAAQRAATGTQQKFLDMFRRMGNLKKLRATLGHFPAVYKLIQSELRRLSAAQQINATSQKAAADAYERLQRAIRTVAQRTRDLIAAKSALQKALRDLFAPFKSLIAAAQRFGANALQSLRNMIAGYRKGVSAVKDFSDRTRKSWKQIKQQVGFAAKGIIRDIQDMFRLARGKAIRVAFDERGSVQLRQFNSLIRRTIGLLQSVTAKGAQLWRAFTDKMRKSTKQAFDGIRGIVQRFQQSIRNAIANAGRSFQQLIGVAAKAKDAIKRLFRGIAVSVLKKLSVALTQSQRGFLKMADVAAKVSKALGSLARKIRKLREDGGLARKAFKLLANAAAKLRTDIARAFRNIGNAILAPLRSAMSKSGKLVRQLLDAFVRSPRAIENAFRNLAKRAIAQLQAIGARGSRIFSQLATHSGRAVRRMLDAFVRAPRMIENAFRTLASRVLAQFRLIGIQGRRIFGKLGGIASKARSSIVAAFSKLGRLVVQQLQVIGTRGRKAFLALVAAASRARKSMVDSFMGIGPAILRQLRAIGNRGRDSFRALIQAAGRARAAMVGAFAGLRATILKHLQAIGTRGRNAFQTLIQAASRARTTMVDAFVGIGPAIMRQLRSIGIRGRHAFDTLIQSASRSKTAMTDAFAGLRTAVLRQLRTISIRGRDAFVSLVQSASRARTAMVDAFVGIGPAVLRKLRAIGARGRDAFKSLVQAAGNAKAAMVGAFAGLRAVVIRQMRAIATRGRDAFLALVAAASRSRKAMVDAFIGLGPAILRQLRKIGARGRDAFNGLIQTAARARAAMVNAFSGLRAAILRQMQAIGTRGRNAFDTLVQAATRIRSAIVGAFSNLRAAVLRQLRAIGTRGRDAFFGLVQAASRARTALVDAFVGIGPAVLRKLRAIGSRGRNAFNALIQAAGNARAAMVGAFAGLRSTILRQLRAIGTRGRDAFVGLVQAASRARMALVDAFIGIGPAILRQLRVIGTRGRDAFRSLIQVASRTRAAMVGAFAGLRAAVIRQLQSIGTRGRDSFLVLVQAANRARVAMVGAFAGIAPAILRQFNRLGTVGGLSLQKLVAAAKRVKISVSGSFEGLAEGIVTQLRRATVAGGRSFLRLAGIASGAAARIKVMMQRLKLDERGFIDLNKLRNIMRAAVIRVRRGFMQMSRFARRSPLGQFFTGIVTSAKKAMRTAVAHVRRGFSNIARLAGTAMRGIAPALAGAAAMIRSFAGRVPSYLAPAIAAVRSFATQIRTNLGMGFTNALAAVRAFGSRVGSFLAPARSAVVAFATIVRNTIATGFMRGAVHIQAMVIQTQRGFLRLGRVIMGAIRNPVAAAIAVFGRLRSAASGVFSSISGEASAAGGGIRSFVAALNSITIPTGGARAALRGLGVAMRFAMKTALIGGGIFAGLGVIIGARLTFQLARSVLSLKKWKMNVLAAARVARKFGSGILGFMLRPIRMLMRPLSMMIGMMGGLFIIFKIVQLFAKFEFRMARVGAIADATTMQFKRLRDQARQLGRDTEFTAQQVADTQAKLATAGFKTNEILKAMPSALRLATAGQMEVADAASIAAQVMRQFRLEAKDMGKATDVLIGSFTRSNTTLQQVGTAMSFVGVVAKEASQDLTTMAATMMELNNAGLAGEKGGTALRNILARLSGGVAATDKLFKKFGIQTIDKTTGKLKQLPDIIDEINEKFKGLGDAARAAEISKAFRMRALPAMQALLRSGGEAIRQNIKVLERMEGVGERIRKRQLDNLMGSFLIMRSAAQDFAISIGESVGPPLRRVVDALKEFFNAASPIAARMKPMFDAIANGIVAGINKISTFLQKNVDTFQMWFIQITNIMNNVGRTIRSAISGVARLLAGIFNIDLGNVDIGKSLAKGVTVLLGVLQALTNNVMTSFKFVVVFMKRSFFQIAAAGVAGFKAIVQAILDMSRALAASRAGPYVAILKVIRTLVAAWEAVLDGLRFFNRALVETMRIGHTVFSTLFKWLIKINKSLVAMWRAAVAIARVIPGMRIPAGAASGALDAIEKILDGAEGARASLTDFVNDTAAEIEKGLAAKIRGPKLFESLDKEIKRLQAGQTPFEAQLRKIIDKMTVFETDLAQKAKEAGKAVEEYWGTMTEAARRGFLELQAQMQLLKIASVFQRAFKEIGKFARDRIAFPIDEFFTFIPSDLIKKVQGIFGDMDKLVKDSMNVTLSPELDKRTASEARRELKELNKLIDELLKPEGERLPFLDEAFAATAERLTGLLPKLTKEQQEFFKAQQKLSQARFDLSKAKATGGAEDVQRAIERVQAAQDALRTAQDRVKKAKIDLGEARQDGDRDLIKAAEQRVLAGQEAVQKAKTKVNLARIELGRVQSAEASPEMIREAERQVSLAQKAVADAQAKLKPDDLAIQAPALDELPVGQAIAALQRLRKSYEDLDAASTIPERLRALQENKEAAKNLTEVMGGLTENQKKYLSSQKQLAEAEDKLAKRREEGAALGLIAAAELELASARKAAEKAAKSAPGLDEFFKFKTDPEKPAARAVAAITDINKTFRAMQKATTDAAKADAFQANTDAFRDLGAVLPNLTANQRKYVLARRDLADAENELFKAQERGASPAVIQAARQRIEAIKEEVANAAKNAPTISALFDIQFRTPENAFETFRNAFQGIVQNFAKDYAKVAASTTGQEIEKLQDRMNELWRQGRKDSDEYAAAQKRLTRAQEKLAMQTTKLNQTQKLLEGAKKHLDTARKFGTEDQVTKAEERVARLQQEVDSLTQAGAITGIAARGSAGIFGAISGLVNAIPRTDTPEARAAAKEQAKGLFFGVGQAMKAAAGAQAEGLGLLGKKFGGLFGKKKEGKEKKEFFGGDVLGVKEFAEGLQKSLLKKKEQQLDEDRNKKLDEVAGALGAGNKKAVAGTAADLLQKLVDKPVGFQ